MMGILGFFLFVSCTLAFLWQEGASYSLLSGQISRSSKMPPFAHFQTQPCGKQLKQWPNRRTIKSLPLENFWLQAVQGTTEIHPGSPTNCNTKRDDEKNNIGEKNMTTPGATTQKMVLIAGFESFNQQLYQKAASECAKLCPEMEILIFTDRDIDANSNELKKALHGADAVFVSLIFDYDQVKWLQPFLFSIPLRLVFESALELMEYTQVGSFNMKPSPGSSSKPGPPKIIQDLLAKFGSDREEDKLAGYLNFLKIGPKLLRFVPGKKVKDLRNWLEIYSYWNQGGYDNIKSMFLKIGQEYLDVESEGGVLAPGKLVETPAIGLIHPAAPGRIFATAGEYLAWHRRDAPRRAALDGAPVAAVLLYRKHVVTGQRYLGQLVDQLEAAGVLPLPIFINGVEAHTVVRDLLTSAHEQDQKRKGIHQISSLSKDAVEVDCIINTIGFPLVGGPAGSMEAGRRTDVAAAILGAKGLPYFVAGPLLVQDINSWRRSGVQGLQSVVLYSLPELDGAVDPVVLGGLAGRAGAAAAGEQTIALVPERVRRLAGRVRAWAALRRTPPARRKVAILVYGFPPNCGAVGTAALMDVPRSLEQVLHALSKEGYDLGSDADKIDGEALIAALKVIAQPNAALRGVEGLQRAVEEACSYHGDATKLLRIDNPEGLAGATVCGQDILPGTLEKWLGKRLVSRMERQWGRLSRQTDLGVNRRGDFVVAGLQLGNVWLGVQPLLGLEGDPMRLMFERDLTPHPQYAAYYQWLAREHGAQALVHFGMHGTAEWLPGSSLGSTFESWPDVLLGALPHLYVYAANNPSESLLAKRRGYAVLVSHNVPPYARAGLYKEVAALKDLVADYREAATQTAAARAAAAGPGGEEENDSEGNGIAALRPLIAASCTRAGLYEDLPFPGQEDGILTPEAAEQVPAPAFDAYAADLWAYLLELENRLFSEGLHVLGRPPTREQALQYLLAYFDGAVPEEVLEKVVKLEPGQGLAELLSQVPADVFSTPTDLSGVRDHTNNTGSTDDITPVTKLTAEEAYIASLSGEDWLRYQYLSMMKGLGQENAAKELESMVAAGAANNLQEGPRSLEEQNLNEAEKEAAATPLGVKLKEAIDIHQLLARNNEEIISLLKGLGGQYIPPGVGGDLLRDGAGVLPTGRNTHALDPYRMPGPAAAARGKEAADRILEAHLQKEGKYPETVAVMLWGLDTIKTRGESIAIALQLIGATAVKEGTGRVVKYALIPLEELGRPRVDVLASLSGIFRDSFANVVDLLDDLIETAAKADEPEEMNYIKKHAREMEAAGLQGSTARLFSNPRGDYGSMVNEKVSSGDWEDSTNLGDTFVKRNSYSYGRGEDNKGVNMPQVMSHLLGTTDRIVQEIDSVEYGLTDIQEYYANTGALKQACESAAARVPGRAGKRVGVSVVEAFARTAEPRELEATLRLEYRTKLLNPKWARAMANQGSGGAYEISQRMTALIGWGGTAGFKDQFVYDGAAETYVKDEEMAAKLRENNPEAFQNVLRRFLEAAGRGFWTPDDETLDKIREMYLNVEDDQEFGGGSIR